MNRFLLLGFAVPTSYLFLRSISRVSNILHFVPGTRLLFLFAYFFSPLFAHLLEEIVGNDDYILDLYGWLELIAAFCFLQFVGLFLPILCKFFFFWGGVISVSLSPSYVLVLLMLNAVFNWYEFRNFRRTKLNSCII